MTIILAKRHSYLPQLSKMKIKWGKKFLWHTETFETFEMVQNTSKLSELNDEKRSFSFFRPIFFSLFLNSTLIRNAFKVRSVHESSKSAKDLNRMTVHNDPGPP